MATSQGMDVEHVRGGARQLAGQLTTIDHLIGQLSVTAKAAENPQSYGISAGELTIAPWSAAAVRTAKSELQAARNAIDELVSRLNAEADAQSLASGNRGPALKHYGKYGASATKSTLSDADLLNYLKGLTAEELAAAIAGDPTIADRLAGMSPEMIADWWNSYEDDQKQALINSMPQVLGNLEGVEYRARDEANRDYLRIKTEELLGIRDDYLAMLDAGETEAALNMLAELGYSTSGSFFTALDAAIEIKDALDAVPDAGAQPSVRQLVSFSLENGEPLAAISVGDLDTADNVSVLVPGITTSVSADMTTWTSTAQNLWLEQKQVLGDHDDTRTLAVVAWLGYETPGSPLAGDGRVFENASAQAGGAKLALALDGLRASLDLGAHSSRLDVVALSYGSTTAFNALTQSSAGTLVVLGSTGPEGTIATADDVDVRQGQVWATEAPQDWIADVGRSGRQDPTSATFGAKTFASDGSGGYLETTTHGGAEHDAGAAGYGYLDRGTDALYNVAQITLDFPPSRPQPGGGGGGGGW
jgi:hypothetical protein